MYKTFLLAGVLILSIACDDFLDKEPTDVKTEKDIYSSFQQTEQQIERLYYWLRAADRPLAQMAHYSESPCCDEAECTSTSEANNLT
ncbi:RagB/SusD family nutrient uptake outer membrane protein, partial [Alistipes onderdonkii]